MPKPKRIQKLYGLKYAVLDVIRKYLAGKPAGMFFEVELLPLIDVASQHDFFVRPKRNAKGIQDFGRLYFRHPTETFELVQLIRERLNDADFQSRNVRRYLLTHKRKASMTDEQIKASMSATGTKVSKASVETERQKLCDELAFYAGFETPEANKFIREGIVPDQPKRPRKRKN